jgi:hypothetical protein
MIPEVTTELANRTSRRGFLGRTSGLLAGVVGLGTGALVLADSAGATGCGCPSGNCKKCESVSCPCVGNRIAFAYYCDSCITGQFDHYECSQITCGARVPGNLPMVQYTGRDRWA